MQVVVADLNQVCEDVFSVRNAQIEIVFAPNNRADVEAIMAKHQYGIKWQTFNNGMCHWTIV